MAHVFVLGAGLVGHAIARDLPDNYDVTVIDRDQARLHTLTEPRIKTFCLDCVNGQEWLQELKAADLVVNALPGNIGFATLEKLLTLKKPVVDISFFEQDPFQLQKSAKSNGVTAIVDCGVAPGLSNMLLGMHAFHDDVDSFVCYVGGLPVQRSWPFEYKAPFSPSDVLEEYTRPARLKEKGEIVTRPALSEPQRIDLAPVGTLEAFNTDGLRTLLETVDIPNMKEKTLRYPGHRSLMEILSHCGFFSPKTTEVNDMPIRPMDLTSKLLFEAWKLEPDEPEITIMRVQIEGKKGASGKPFKVRYDLYDTFMLGISSMARTTGYTCTAAVRLILEKGYSEPGIIPPEWLARDLEHTNYILGQLAQRSVHVNRLDLE